MEGFKGLFQGGNCAGNAQMGTSGNQFKNFMEGMGRSTQQHGNLRSQTGTQNLDSLMQNFDSMWLQNQSQQPGQSSYLQEIQKRQAFMKQQTQGGPQQLSQGTKLENAILVISKMSLKDISNKCPIQI